MQDLMDDDGENRAVRAFLMFYGAPGLRVGTMKTNMKFSGYPFWPAWVDSQEGEHLTKGGAQSWLRHLFALEPPPPMTVHTPCARHKNSPLMLSVVAAPGVPVCYQCEQENKSG